MAQRDKAWEAIFSGESIPQTLEKQGWATVTAEIIRKKYHKEPRLLAKTDAYEALPEVFRKNDAALLSLTNEEYAILRLGNKGKPLFPKLPPVLDSPKHIDIEHCARRIVTLPWEEHFASESQAIDAALAARILQDFVGDENLVLTIRGRRRFQKPVPLRFSLKGRVTEFPLKARGFQIEVDGGYESPRHVYLLEAKNKAHKTFNLRQVMFPYLFWKDYLRAREANKSVRPIYLIYTAHNYFLYEFTVEKEDVLNALRVVRAGWYVLGTPPLTLAYIREMLQGHKPDSIPHIPFPQADSFLRLYDILEEVKRKGALTANEIAEYQEFTLRQGNYYASAAQWLGWMEKQGNAFVISKDGKRLLAVPLNERPRLILQRLAQRPVFHNALQWWATSGKLPEKSQIGHWIVQAIESKQIKPLSQSTIPRRASTVAGWLQILAAWVKTP